VKPNALSSFLFVLLGYFAATLRLQAVMPPPDGCYHGFTTAEGCDALNFLTTGVGNTGVAWRSLFSAQAASFNTGVGAGTLVLNQADANTGVGTAALLLNRFGGRNTAVGAAAMVFNDGRSDGNGSFNGAFGAFALNANEDGFSNNAMGDSALFRNIHGAQNTAVGDLALEVNDATGDGTANNNTAVGAASLNNSFNGSENTAVGAGAGINLAVGFNNTYLGNFVGSYAADEDSTIRIADISNGNGAGSLECYVGGIWNNPQLVGGSVVAVTLDLNDDHLGYDPGVLAPAARSRAAPQPRTRPQPRQAMLYDKVEKLRATVAQQQVTVAQQQKQIETLTTQLREQGEQIQKVSAQLELSKLTPQTVKNTD
jgi:uncharacterized coiled-coil protein SlyX